MWAAQDPSWEDQCQLSCHLSISLICNFLLKALFTNSGHGTVPCFTQREGKREKRTPPPPKENLLEIWWPQDKPFRAGDRYKNPRKIGRNTVSFAEIWPCAPYFWQRKAPHRMRVVCGLFFFRPCARKRRDPTRVGPAISKAKLPSLVQVRARGKLPAGVAGATVILAEASPCTQTQQAYACMI